MPGGHSRTNSPGGNIVALPPFRKSHTGEKRGVFRPETLQIIRPNHEVPGNADGRRW